ncbi:Methionyl-tRNA synthetase [Acidilobus saccharovorans 345-15]|uniref:Methionine--tRNA ligase n=1 Tax=Acidilobus saccharovorans (strain DSM 16705 / JCM 18335 / VKM B-2471 / 345-15) TaxID=666510 RepID=D9Q005_ACIS3|nr:methionine--tRNA ligase [Acidilobus saccharovorans]ADL18643.1 Methionyl-tRNA synthetase [Acidilobus saccharovorans 345-15]
MGKYIVASAWPYSNFIPHLGTVLHLLSADVYARYLKLMGHDVVFVTGSDEHGTPIELEARKRGIKPKELTDQVHAYDVELFKKFEFDFSLYSRTESPIHKEFVREFFLNLQRRGYVFPQDEEMPYCPNDKMFLPDRFIEGTCPYCGYEHARGDQCDNCGRLLTPRDLINPRCAICGATPIWLKTTNYYIDLGKVQEKLLSWLQSSELQDSVKNYSIEWVKQGLKPRALTRDIEWGIQAPFEGAENKTIYVWFDALLGYVSATKEYLMSKGGDENSWKQWWFDPSTRSVYFIGKDNIPFHSIILPSLFMASGDPYVLPWRISATDYLLYEGRHFSKSRRVGVWIDEALEIAPADYWRWALIRMRPESGDVSFQWKEFYRIVNSELNDDIGNLAYRVLSFVKSRFDGVMPPATAPDTRDKETLEEATSLASKVIEHMDNVELKRASEFVLEVARLGNRYLNESAPWDLIKRDRERAGTVINVAASIVKTVAHLITPFMPSIAEDLWHQLGFTGSVMDAKWPENLGKPISGGSRIGEIHPLFRKLPEDFLNNIERIIEESRAKANSKRPPLLKDYGIAG